MSKLEKIRWWIEGLLAVLLLLLVLLFLSGRAAVVLRCEPLVPGQVVCVAAPALVVFAR